MKPVDAGTWWQIASLVALAVLVLIAMRAGWRRRERTTAATVPAPTAVPADGAAALGAEITPPVEATYVSTTFADRLLERVVAHGLGTRSSAVVRVHEQGVLVERPGATDLYVPASRLDGTATAAGMAGKHVGGHGLVLLHWRAGDDGDAVRLATGLRLAHRADTERLRTAVDGLTAAPAGDVRADDSRTEDAPTEEDNR